MVNNGHLLSLGDSNSDVAYQTIVEHITSTITQANVTEMVESLITTSKDSIANNTSEQVEHLCEELGIKSENHKNILKIVLKVNEIVAKLNELISFESVLCKSLFKFSDIKRSDATNNNYRALTVCERVVTMMYILIDILLNHDSKNLNAFVTMVGKLGAKSSAWNLFHSLYHKIPENSDFRTCVTDGYIFVKMISNIVREEHISNNYISLSVFEEHCEEYKCEMVNWMNQGLWMTIVQTAIYMKNLKVANERVVFGEFLSERGGMILALMGGMYLNKKLFNVMYNIGMIYSLMFDETTLTLIDNDSIRGVETEHGIDFIASINDLVFDGSANVVCIGFNNLASSTHKNDKVIYQVIERQTDGYVYHDVYSTKNMNVSHVVYMDDIAADQVRHADIYKQMIYESELQSSYSDIAASDVTVLNDLDTTLSRPINGGRLTGGATRILFNEQQMSYLTEWGTAFVCLMIVIFVVAMIVRNYRERKPIKIEKNTDGKLDSRVYGTINENIPLTLL